jgi:hypothetical protein
MFVIRRVLTTLTYQRHKIQDSCPLSAPLDPPKMLRYSTHICSFLASPAVVFWLPLSPRQWGVNHRPQGWGEEVIKKG